MPRARPAVARVVLLLAVTAAACSPASAGTSGFECPVTTPPQPGFSPPHEWPAEPSLEGAVWFGDADLWTVLSIDGAYQPRKSVWWSANFPGGGEEEQPPITVTWRRLGRDTKPHAEHQGTNAYTVEDGWFMIAGIDPGSASDGGPWRADAGCWEVTAQYKGATLSYVYESP